MGSRIEDDCADCSARRSESLESLMESTDRTTEEIVEALRESGPRRHVSETNVDDVLEELSRPRTTEADGAFALSGGPTRTISTTGIDDVFETLEAEAPPLAPDPCEHDVGSAVGRSPAAGRGREPTRERATADESTDSFGALSGGEPTRTVSDQSVDDILSLLEEGESTEDDEPVDDATALRPANAEEQLASLLSDADESLDDTQTPPTADPVESGTDAPRPGPTDDDRPDAVTVDRSSAMDVEAAAAEINSLNPAASDPDDASTTPSTEPTAGPEPGGPSSDSEPGDVPVDPDPAELPSDPTPNVAPGTPDEGDRSSPADAVPTVDESASTAEPRPLVTRAELEEIASLVSDADPGETIAGSRPSASTPEPSVVRATGAEPRPTADVTRTERRSTPGATPDSAGSTVTVADVAPPTVGRAGRVSDSGPSRTVQVTTDGTACAAETDGTSGDDADRDGRTSPSRSVIARVRALGRRVLRRVRR